jgi:hypothetical protein
MATKPAVIQNHLPIVKTITWENFTAADDVGEHLITAHYSDKTVTVFGNFGSGGSMKMEGSNDGVNWFDMTDPQGNALTFTAAKMEMLQENPLYVRPKMTAGTSVDIDVILCGVG